MTNHEYLPSGNEPNGQGPDAERLQPGEIDFTGAVPQRQDMLDLIGDAFTEQQASGGEIPDWGARAIARILADGLEPGSALHQFAVTGRADPDAISKETIPIYAAPDTPAEVKRWIDYLGTFLLHQDDQNEVEAAAITTGAEPYQSITIDLSTTPDDEVAPAVIRRAITLAKRTGGKIHAWIATAIARELADRMPEQRSALNTFANTQMIHRDRLAAETQAITRAEGTSDEVREWISYFTEFIAAQDTIADATSDTEALELGSQGAEGIRTYGDAFRAFLQLSDIDPAREDLLDTFHEVYVGSFTTMQAVIEGLTEITDWRAATEELAERFGIRELLTLDYEKIEKRVFETWDIKRVNGVLYAFDK